MQELKELVKTNNLDKKLMTNFNKALKDDDFKEFIDKLGMTYEELCKYTSILEESKEEYCHCKNCKNIMECKNKICGYAYLPKVKDNKITFNYQMCRYNKEMTEKNRYLENVYTFKEPNEIVKADIKEIYKEDNARLKVIKYILKFIKEYQDGKNPKGLYLHGSFGSGKTYLVSAMLNELAKKNIKSAIIFWPEYLRLLKSSFNNDEYKTNFDLIKTSPILLIDDIGAENVTPWSRDEILCSILQYRMEEHLPTFFTSNLDINSLEHHLSISKDGTEEIKARRIIERIKQLTCDEELISKNLRK